MLADSRIFFSKISNYVCDAQEIIPVRVDSYQPDGWLGAILGTKLWYQMACI